MRKILSVVAVYMVSVVLMALQKPIFLLWYASRSAEFSLSELFNVSLHGLYLDSTVAGYLSVIPWLVAFLSVWIPLSERLYRRVMRCYIWVVSIMVSLLVTVDMGLFRYWDFRLDSTILQYLVSPKEAMASVTWSDIFPAVVLFVGYLALMVVGLTFVLGIYRVEKKKLLPKVGQSFSMLLLGGLLFLAIRGGVSPAPANVSKVYFSENMFLNQAATNPIFSFLSSAARSELKQSDYQYFSEQECDQIFEELRGGEKGVTESVLKSLRPNVVLILLESFGRATTDLVVQGREVTPYLNRLKREGISFENLYANSFRTDRGTVATLSGYPAHPVVSVMKYPQKAHTLPSIAGRLAEAGYATSFMYGGDANFTNTSSYLYGTGIQQIVDQDDMKLDAPTSKWGYADDVVCELFADQVLELAKQKEPFFASLLTLSSHEPFEVPYSAFEDKILNSTAFTDEQVGRMIEKWRDSEAWENLLVVLVADHGISYPADVAIGTPKRQRIPMVWCGGAVKESMRVDRFASQADLATTLLSQMDLSAEEFVFSRDIFSQEEPKFGFWSFNNGFGVISEKGYLLYDCTAEKIMEKDCDSFTQEEFLRNGKALVQKIHQDICRR